MDVVAAVTERLGRAGAAMDPGADGDADVEVLAMRWRDALFAHWPVARRVVDERLPERLAPDTHGGDAYLGVVAFVLEAVRPRPLPAALGRSFGEVNLRTYVRDRETGDRGIYFFSLDADDWLGVALARRLYALPYYRAAMSVDRTPVPGGNRVRVRSERTHRGTPVTRFEAAYEPADAATIEAGPGSIAAFLTERYRFYTTDGDGHVRAGDVAHSPWPLCEAIAQFRRNALFAVNGFERPAGDPLVHYSPGVDVTAGPLRRVGR